MAKRYTDSNKWDDPWYLDLPANYKLAWDYITSKCDSVGVWKPSQKHVEFNVGTQVDLVAFLKICGPERIAVINGGSWWIRKFCDFQYGELKEDSKSQTTISYIKNLKKHNLWEAYMKGIDRLCNSPKDKDKDKDKEEEEDKPLIKKSDENASRETEQIDFHGPDIPGDTIIFPIDTQPARILWTVWKKYRWEKYNLRYGMMGEQADLKRFEGMTFTQIEATILAAISNGWKNLYPDKNNGKPISTNTKHQRNLNDLQQGFAARHGNSDILKQ